MTGNTSTAPHLRIGIDLGGTKIEGIALDRQGEIRARRRTPTPRDDYHGVVSAICGLVEAVTAEADVEARLPPPSIGIGMPGSLAPRTGLVQNANSTILNGRPLATDLTQCLGRPVRFANDANCFALSEAVDGAGAGRGIVFGVILGTGCGGGIVIDGRLLNGPRGIGGEWGHNPLPQPDAGERRIAPCWCGRSGCLETWVSGPGLAADHFRTSGEPISVEEIVARAEGGDHAAAASLGRHAERLARGMAQVVNVIDPDVIVLGGGLSNITGLYARLPALIAPLIFAEDQGVRILPPRWGDSSGVRGAAWLWD